MSRLLRLSSLLLLSGSLAAQTPGPRILVKEAPVAKHTEKESQAVDLLASRLSDYLQELIPCSCPSTMQDVRDLLGEARTRELLGNDDTAEMKQVLEQVGVRDLVSVNATEMGNQMVLTVFYMDMRTAKAETRDTAPVAGDEASIDAFAQKFVAGMKALPRFANLGACPADKKWYGTIRAVVDKTDERTTTEKQCTSTVKTRDFWSYTVHIPRLGKPSAYVVHPSLQKDYNVCKRQVWCTERDKRRVLETQVNTYTKTVQTIGSATVDVRVSTDAIDGRLYVGALMGNLPVNVSVNSTNLLEGPCADGKLTESSAPDTALVLPVQGFRFPNQAVTPGQKLVQGTRKEKDSRVSWRLTRAGSVSAAGAN